MCKEEYKLGSRYRDVNTTLKRLEDKKYVATTTGLYTRVLFHNDDENKKGIYAVDFEGGPMIYSGEKIADATDLGEVESIESTENGYILTFK